MSSVRNCPICDQTFLDTMSFSEYEVKCLNCGHYTIAPFFLLNMGDLDQYSRATLSHHIWRKQSGRSHCNIESRDLEEAKSNGLPNPAEKLELLVLYIGDCQGSVISQFVHREASQLIAKVGAVIESDVEDLIIELKKCELIEPCDTDLPALKLTMAGWRLYGELRRGRDESQTAFMAMKFGESDVALAFKEAFQPGALAAGYRLEKVDDDHTAGLIDDKIQVKIRTSRFIVADLTHGNNGAYWEAGFAAGLGKPVFYTCEKSHFENHKTHFDTNHFHTVLWDTNNLDDAKGRLVAAIRATLPGEAIMND